MRSAVAVPLPTKSTVKMTGLIRQLPFGHPLNVALKVNGTVIVTFVMTDGTTKEFPPNEMFPEYPTPEKDMPLIVAVPPPPIWAPMKLPPTPNVCPATHGAHC